MQLSVIIPMYNASATIAHTLASLALQSVQDWEALVVDDGSTDGGKSAAIVERHSARDPRIHLIRQPNGGVCTARNRALDIARGDFFLFLDSDDLMLPGGVDLLLETARSGGTGAAIGKFEMLGHTGHTLSIEGPWSEEITLNHLLGGIFMAPHCHMVARKYFKPESNLPEMRFDPDTKLIEDTDVWLKLAERGVRWRNCQKPVCAYRMRADSRSVDFAGMLQYTVRVHENAYARVAAAKKAGVLPDTLDDSRSRLDSLLGIAAAGYCTRLAISRADAACEAFRLLQTAPGLKSFEPYRLARAGRHAVMFALGERPKPPTEENSPQWWIRLQQWWGMLEQAGWVASGDACSIATQFIELSRKAETEYVPPQRVSWKAA